MHAMVLAPVLVHMPLERLKHILAHFASLINPLRVVIIVKQIEKLKHIVPVLFDVFFEFALQLFLFVKLFFNDFQIILEVLPKRFRDLIQGALFRVLFSHSRKNDGEKPEAKVNQGE